MRQRRHQYTQIQKHLKKPQITLIIGARQTGKTTLLQQLSHEIPKTQCSSITLEDPEILKRFNDHPSQLLKVLPPLTSSSTQDAAEKHFVFIDEIQYLDNPSNFLKYHYDLHRHQLKFVVTGSSSFYIDEKFNDSLAGRKRIFELATLSLEEFLSFKGYEEWGALIHQEESIPLLVKPKLVQLLEEYILYGGYPEVVLEESVEEKQLLLQELALSYVKKDFIEAKVKHLDVCYALMRLLGSQVGGLLNRSELSSTLKVSHSTVDHYLYLMQRSFHISFIKTFSGNYRKELTKMPKVYFNDLGLRNALLGNFTPLSQREDRGDLFENLVFRRLFDFYPLEQIQFWRTQSQQEVDFIYNQSTAIEAKFNESQYRASKYKSFRQHYPELPFHLVHMENVLEFPFTQLS